MDRKKSLFSSIKIVIIIFFCIPCSLANTNTSSMTEWPFPAREIQMGFYDNDFMPTNIPHPPHPLFWTSRLKTNGGITVSYQWLEYHTKKYFSVNLATSLSDWIANSDHEIAASFFFVVRVWLFRTSSFNPYFDWSIGGPTLLSNRMFSTANLGGIFIFQDFFGLGAIIGKKQRFDMNVNIYHYSNGDLFIHNDGWDVPMVFSIGYVFD